MLERISCSFIKMCCYWCFGEIPSDRQNNRLFCGDNCNKNGGTGRKGTNNVFSEPNKSLQVTIHNACCATHILHSRLHSSAVILSVDVKSIVNKIFQYPQHLYSKGQRTKISIHLWKMNMNKSLVVQKLCYFH